MKYPPVSAGERIQPVRRGYKMKCCDCGLVHTFNFYVHRGRAQFRAWRDQRATAAGRREERKRAAK